MLDRYDKFLSNYEFHSNSIEFRIQSSKALEKFKNVQAFQLNQLINGRFFFAKDRREILLLKYDMWSRWLYEIENYFIEMSGNYSSTVTANDVDMMIKLAEKTQDAYYHIMKVEFPNEFDQTFADIWLELHSVMFPHFLNEINQTCGSHRVLAFAHLVDVLVDIMQYTLEEIHELDAMMCKFRIRCTQCPNNVLCPQNKHQDGIDSTPFIIIGAFADKILEQTGVSLVAERIEIYKKHFDMRKVFLKNYTDESISTKMIASIHNARVSIDFKKSLVQN